MSDWKSLWKSKLLIDGFTFYARVLPAVVCALPLFLTSVINIAANGFNLKNIILVVILFAAVAFGTNIVRKLGKAREKKLYDKLHAMPTTIIQRFSDTRINAVSKKQYHSKLNKIYGLKLPLSPDEEHLADDDGYMAAADSLRNLANSNRDKYPRVYQELKEYNFSRNLYGLKWYAVAVYVLLAAVEIYKLVRTSINIQSVFDVVDMLVKPSGSTASVYIYLIAIALCLLFVTFSSMEERAFDYAKALIEVCEGLDENSSLCKKES